MTLSLTLNFLISCLIKLSYQWYQRIFNSIILLRNWKFYLHCFINSEIMLPVKVHIYDFSVTCVYPRGGFSSIWRIWKSYLTDSTVMQHRFVSSWTIRRPYLRQIPQWCTFVAEVSYGGASIHLQDDSSSKAKHLQPRVSYICVCDEHCSSFDLFLAQLLTIKLL